MIIKEVRVFTMEAFNVERNEKYKVKYNIH